ncbi:uncharacterized protein LOC131624425 [Vicia villosa]|uniref:uncharacterized protein LOC131624425 n=1 Tax=Vicia villosa TaxID=3911 RepID=UPI00273C2917|nr:uncharacterized protein LOC131624425 [Vicia villosa]
MVRQASLEDFYKGFQLTSDVEYNLLQFADDTILFGEGTWENLCSLKVLFRGFELVSGLRINLAKTKLYAVGCDKIFQDGKGALWSGVMKAQYGDLNSRVWNYDGEAFDPKDSLWWRDLLDMCGNSRGSMHSVAVKIGSGNFARFWNSHWLGRDYLSNLFPRLLLEAGYKNDTVQDLGYWLGENWFLKVIKAQEVLGQQATGELAELHTLLADVAVCSNSEDVFVWPFDVSKSYTVRSSYNLSQRDQEGGRLDMGINQGLQLIWASQVPSKLKIFCRRVILDRIPTRNQLLRRGIIAYNKEALCAFYELHCEDPSHIFIFSPMIQNLWDRIKQWLDIDSHWAVDCCSQILVGVTTLSGKIQCKRAAVIWVTIWWCIWKVRYNIIFNNAVFDGDELFYSILWHSWWWLAIEAKDRIRSFQFSLVRVEYP